MHPYAEWVASVQTTEDVTALALDARDRLAAARLWLTWQVRRRRVEDGDGQEAIADIDAGLAFVALALDALRTHRGELSGAKPEG